MKKRIYAAIDLKSFYASVECRDRGLDPLETNLVVADESRTEKTICLAVSPSLKSFGVPSRPRLFEVISKVKEINAIRKRAAGGLRGKSWESNALKENADLAVDYIVAPPRMARYIEYSARIYKVYLKYLAPEDIHVYSIDEVFMDLTDYLKSYNMTAKELVAKIIREVLETTGITATAGIGTNLYLCKVAMDIVAKKMPPDDIGARIAELDEESYRRTLWNHRPLTDFWRVGAGYASRLEGLGIYTMGDIAACSIGADSDFYNEELLYGEFGVNAELLIDHAWGHESCTMSDIKSYKPESTSLGSGQVLHCPYETAEARVVTIEMADQLAEDLFDRGLVSDSITLTINYDAESLPRLESSVAPEIGRDYYGRRVPKHAHGTKKLTRFTSSSTEITRATEALFDEIVNSSLLIRRINIVANRTITALQAEQMREVKQLSFFDSALESDGKTDDTEERDKRIQGALSDIKRRFGKNSIFKGLSLTEGSTAIDRNSQIGGHKA